MEVGVWGEGAGDEGVLSKWYFFRNNPNIIFLGGGDVAGWRGVVGGGRWVEG